MKPSIKPVIMCGGAGTRLWPISRDTMPKQFAPLIGTRSSFQETVLRVKAEGFDDNVLVITSAGHRYIVEAQLAELGVKADLVLEPLRRDTGAAILAGCLAVAEHDPNTPILILAADHLVRDAAAFREAVMRGLPSAASGHLIAFGIVPTAPASEYGYIVPREGKNTDIRPVDRFVEKPNRSSADQLLTMGALWNSGDLLFEAWSLAAEYARLEPSTFQAVNLAVASARRDGSAITLDAASFGRAENKSIDYAVMERTDRAVVVPISCGWSDIGSFDALWSVAERDSKGNAARGGVELNETQNCFVSSNGRLTCLVGVENLVVVAERDAVLVVDRRRSADVKALVDLLRSKGRAEADTHAQVRRPWGFYESLERGDGFQVKRIVVHPGGRLSLQKHRCRSEHWVVVGGEARVTVGTQVSLLVPGQHVHIPLGAVHRLENFGTTAVELIEVQSGSYLGEDDIVRLEDVYHRETSPPSAPNQPDVLSDRSEELSLA